MKKITALIATLIPLCSLFYSCNDDSTLGASLMQDQITITIDSAFTVKGRSVRIDSVQSRTVSKLIGCIDAKGFGKLSSDFVAQFMPATSLDTANIKVENIDSLVLVMGVPRGTFVGDSVAPLGIEVYELDKMLPSPIFSNFNPKDYYNPNKLLGKTVYNTAWTSSPDKSSAYYTFIRVHMPLQLGKDIYAQYEKNPEVFSSPTEFAKNIFPGVYIKNSFGSGRITSISSTMLSLYYHYKYTNPETQKDTILYKSGNYFAITPEIVSNNNIKLQIDDNIKQRVAQGQNIVMAPIGLEVEMDFPAKDIIGKFKNSEKGLKVINSLKFSIPAERISNDYDMLPPTYLLMVLKSEKEKFFANNSLPDNKTSFYAKYDSSTGLYDFGEMRSYIMNLLEKDNLTADDYTFVLTPVTATFEQNTTSSSYYSYYYGSSNTETLSMLTPYVASPCMARLLLDNAKIRLTFSSQTLAN